MVFGIYVCEGCQIHNLKNMMNPLECVELELSFGILELYEKFGVKKTSESFCVN